MTAPFIAPGATLGVMGGGQLGRMFVHAAQQMGYFTAVLDADPALLLYFAAPVTRHPRQRTTVAFNGPQQAARCPERCGGVPCGVK